MRRLGFDSVFASILLAACSRAALAPVPVGATPTTEVSRPLVQRAPAVVGGAPSGFWINISAGTKEEARAIAKAMEATIPLSGEMPAGIDVLVPIRQTPDWAEVIGTSASPIPPSVLAMVPQVAPTARYLWHTSAGWFAGTLEEALVPLTSLEHLALYIDLVMKEQIRLALISDSPLGTPVSGPPTRWHAVEVEDGFEVVVSAHARLGPCPQSNETTGLLLLHVAPSGLTRVLKSGLLVPSSKTPCIGRDTAGSGRGEVAPANDRGAYFTQLARDEHTSIGSFRRLAAEIAAAGAPAALSARALAAADDEVRHAEAMATLAAAAGAPVVLAPVRAYPVRAIATVLEENAREGCVRETYAALVAAHQAQHAATTELRATFALIAADERRHAELAWAIDRWAQCAFPALVPRLAAARAEALAELDVFLTARPRQAWHAEVGEPSPAVALSLLARLQDRSDDLAAAAA